MKFPALISPFSHGVDPAGGFKYLRALFGLAVSGVIGVAVTCVTKPRALVEIEGLVVGTIRQAMEKYKGGPVNIQKGEQIEGRLEVIPGTKRVSVHSAAMERLQARVGDLVYVSDARRWLGGLRSVHAFLDVPHPGDPDTVEVTDDLIREGDLLPSRRHRVEKIF